MLIAHILREKGGVVHWVSESATLEEAAQDLTRKRVGALVALNAQDRLVGVLSERDIVREIGRRGPACLLDPVSTAMTRDVIVAGPRETVDECLARMTDRRIRHLPVMHEGELMGVVSIGDLVASKIALAEAEARAMRDYIAAG